MRKWWRKFKNQRGWDFHKKQRPGYYMTRINNNIISIISDEYGIYSYRCSYCGKVIMFPWRETNLAYHNMQRHIKAKHIDAL
jgi:hypothetical protein